MSYAARHAGKVTDKCELIPSDQQAWRAAVSKHRGHSVWITVTRQQRMHSPNQQRYWRGVVVPMYCEAYNEKTGKTYNVAQMHEALVRAIIGPEIDGPLEFIPSSATFTVEQFTKLIDGARTDAERRLDLYIPEPNQVEVVL